MSMDLKELLGLVDYLEQILKGAEVQDVKVSLCWPGNPIAGRELTEADVVEAQRRANEEWYIKIGPDRG